MTQSRLFRQSGAVSAALVLTLLAAAQAWAAEDRVLLDDTRITGNQELPKVLYLLPWQRPGGPEGLTLAPVFDDSILLEPIDPAAFRRLLRLQALVSGADLPGDDAGNATLPEEN